jgi:hypothetical protein
MQRALQFNYLKPALLTLECRPFRLERLLHTQEAGGSSPSAPTINSFVLIKPFCLDPHLGAKSVPEVLGSAPVYQ